MVSLAGVLGRGVSRGAKSISSDLEKRSARQFQNERDEAMFLRQQSLAQLGIDATAEQNKLNREQQGLLQTERLEQQQDLAEMNIDAADLLADKRIEAEKLKSDKEQLAREKLLEREFELKAELQSGKGLSGDNKVALNKQATEIIKAQDELKDPKTLKAEAQAAGFKSVAAHRKARADKLFQESLVRIGAATAPSGNRNFSGEELQILLEDDPKGTLALLKSNPNTDPEIIKVAEAHVASLLKTTPPPDGVVTKKKSRPLLRFSGTDQSVLDAPLGLLKDISLSGKPTEE